MSPVCDRRCAALFVLSLAALLVLGSPPKLTSLTYRRIDDMPTPNQWETMSMAVVTATFDQNISYRDQSCPGPRTKATFGPCISPFFGMFLAFISVHLSWRFFHFSFLYLIKLRSLYQFWNLGCTSWWCLLECQHYKYK
jgi:hypothetical protein